MKILLLVVILTVVAAPVFGYCSFFDLLKKLEECRTEHENPFKWHSTLIKGDDGVGQLFRDVVISDVDKDLEFLLMLLNDLQKLETRWERLLNTNKKPQSLFYDFRNVDGNFESMFNTFDKSKDVPKKHFENLDKKK